MLNKSIKRVTLFSGHYGSGKTNIAVNYAYYLKSKGLPVVIADLDIVNPYFRTKDSQQELENAGVEVITLPYANTNVDLPSIPSSAYSLVEDKSKYAVIDVGGDDRGAYALGRFSGGITEENNFDNFYVVNFFRPLTSTANDAKTVLDEIELAGKVPFTGIINNSNLGEETTLEDIISTYGKAQELSSITGLPIVFTCAEKGLLNCEDSDFFGLCLQKKYW